MPRAPGVEKYAKAGTTQLPAAGLHVAIGGRVGADAGAAERGADGREGDEKGSQYFDESLWLHSSAWG